VVDSKFLILGLVVPTRVMSYNPQTFIYRQTEKGGAFARLVSAKKYIVESIWGLALIDYDSDG
jgi:hypothetical protein